MSGKSTMLCNYVIVDTHSCWYNSVWMIKNKSVTQNRTSEEVYLVGQVNERLYTNHHELFRNRISWICPLFIYPWSNPSVCKGTTLWIMHLCSNSLFLQLPWKKMFTFSFKNERDFVFHFSLCHLVIDTELSTWTRYK